MKGATEMGERKMQYKNAFCMGGKCGKSKLDKAQSNTCTLTDWFAMLEIVSVIIIIF